MTPTVDQSSLPVVNPSGSVASAFAGSGQVPAELNGGNENHHDAQASGDLQMVASGQAKTGKHNAAIAVGATLMVPQTVRTPKPTGKQAALKPKPTEKHNAAQAVGADKTDLQAVPTPKPKVATYAQIAGKRTADADAEKRVDKRVTIPCRSATLNTTIPALVGGEQDHLGEIRKAFADAPALPVVARKPKPTLFAVTTRIGATKLMELLGTGTQTDMTVFEYNPGMVLVRAFDNDRNFKPADIMRDMDKAKLGCLCGHAESDTTPPGLVYSRKDSAMAERAGTLTLSVPTIRVRRDGTKEFQADWATQAWIQKAIVLLQPAAASITPHGHLLVVPGRGQSVATLMKEAEAAGLVRIAFRLPVTEVYVARLLFPTGTDTDELAMELEAVGEHARTQGFVPVGPWDYIAPGRATLQLMRESGPAPPTGPQTFKVGENMMASIHLKSGPDPWPAKAPARGKGPTPAGVLRQQRAHSSTAAFALPTVAAPKPATPTATPTAPAIAEDDEDMRATRTNDIHNEVVLEAAIDDHLRDSGDHPGNQDNFLSAMERQQPNGGPITQPGAPVVGTALAYQIEDIVSRLPLSTETALIKLALDKVADKTVIRMHPSDLEISYATIAFCVADAWETSEPTAFLAFAQSAADPLSAPIALSCSIDEHTNRIMGLSDVHRDQHALARYFARATPETQAVVLKALSVEEAAYALAEAAGEGSAARTVLLGVFARRFLKDFPRWEDPRTRV